MLDSPAPMRVLALLPGWLVYFVTGRRVELRAGSQKTAEAAEQRAELQAWLEQRILLYKFLSQLRYHSDRIDTLQKGMEDLKTQNSVLVKTMRDIHAVLLTLSSQGAEQKTEIYELRKRLTDFHEDSVGRFLLGESSGSKRVVGGMSSSSYYSESFEAEGGEFSASEESICALPIDTPQRSSGHDKTGKRGVD